MCIILNDLHESLTVIALLDWLSNVIFEEIELLVRF